MTRIDLKTAETGGAEMTCDVCIAGAGAAGLYLANRLARTGLEVVVLEAGGEKCLDGAEVGIEPVLSGSRYGGTAEGRAFGLGGTTARWGGQLIPHAGADLRTGSDPAAHEAAGADADERFDAWRYIVNVVNEQSQTVHGVLGLGDAHDYHTLADRLLGDRIAAVRAAGFETIAAEWLPFRRRNLRFLIEADRAVQDRVRMYLHAVACRWRVERSTDGGNRVRSVEARSGSGNTVTVTAGAFVVAAGTIESARMVLEIERAAAGALFDRDAAAGAFLSDHLSCRIGRVAKADTATAAGLFGPRFRRNTMRSFKFVDAAPSADDPRWCCHFVFDVESGGFALARKLLGGLQARKLPSVTAGEVVGGVTGLGRLAAWRLLRRRLFVPPGSTVYVQLNIEQQPREENGVTLADEPDAYGRPKAVVRWGVSEDDHRHIARVAERFMSRWPADLLRVERADVAIEDEVMTQPHDVYHPVGTCRLGTDGRAVVDPDLRVHGTSNLSVLSTAVFPTAGTANPTFSMLCFAERLANRLIEHRRRDAGGNAVAVNEDDTKAPDGPAGPGVKEAVDLKR